MQTDAYEGMIADMGRGHFPESSSIPHMPGWDEFYRETARRFTQRGYMVVCPDIYCRIGHDPGCTDTAKHLENTYKVAVTGLSCRYCYPSGEAYHDKTEKRASIYIDRSAGIHSSLQQVFYSDLKI